MNLIIKFVGQLLVVAAIIFGILLFLDKFIITLELKVMVGIIILIIGNIVSVIVGTFLIKCKRH